MSDKFNVLKGEKVPTGNPTIPPRVRRAKHIQHMIRNKVVNREISVERANTIPLLLLDTNVDTVVIDQATQPVLPDMDQSQVRDDTPVSSPHSDTSSSSSSHKRRTLNDDILLTAVKELSQSQATMISAMPGTH